MARIEGIQEKHDNATETDAGLPAPLDIDRPKDPQLSTANDTATEVEHAAPSQTQAASADTMAAEKRDDAVGDESNNKPLNNDEDDTPTGVLRNNQEGLQSTPAQDAGNSASESNTVTAAEDTCREAMMDLALNTKKMSRWSPEMDKELFEYLDSGLRVEEFAHSLVPLEVYVECAADFCAADFCAADFSASTPLAKLKLSDDLPGPRSWTIQSSRPQILVCRSRK